MTAAAIESALAGQPEVIISVRGKDRFVAESAQARARLPKACQQAPETKVASRRKA
ncbi:hypothetical protein [Aquabacterium sp.]|uniref:hypothetical protein n=1 Tax=Aquabacterium sp. TaxID=1872578 RepID=UPI0019A18AC3|nr:hypothetical protein [Aquabacterium sp.]MBC7699197.1 hypothetical protein [Aquabacterium sp.]